MGRVVMMVRVVVFIVVVAGSGWLAAVSGEW
jgi:hypothetical protein